MSACKLASPERCRLPVSGWASFNARRPMHPTVTSPSAGRRPNRVKPRSRPDGARGVEKAKDNSQNRRYWGVASLCFAAFATCGALVLGSWFLCRSHHKENYHPSLGFKVALCLFLATVVAAAFWLAAWYFAGAVLKKWLMAYDTSFLGVEVYVDRIALNPFLGTVLVQNMTLGNPEGYTSEYLAKDAPRGIWFRVRELYVNVNMGESVRSLGHRLTLDQAHVRGVDVVFERALTTSNVEDVLDRLGVIQHFAPPTGKGSQGFHVDLHVHEVQSSDVWVRAKLNLQGMYGILTQVPNISWHDFETQTLSLKLLAQSLHAAVALQFLPPGRQLVLSGESESDCPCLAKEWRRLKTRLRSRATLPIGSRPTVPWIRFGHRCGQTSTAPCWVNRISMWDETNTPVEQEEEAPEAPKSMMSLVHDFLENWELSMTREVFLRETTVQPLRREDLVNEFASMTIDPPSGSQAVLEQVLASARRQRRSAVPEAIPEEQCR
eukprot:s2208_g2.t2